MEDYTTRELGILLENLHGKMDDQKGVLVEISNQVKKTNGRVTCLERWQSAIKGGLIIVSLILVPLFIEFVKNILK